MGELQQLQKSQMEILKEIDRVCKKHNLTYCLAFGSCLGAVRHQGFIPWDDDIDIYMPIHDFEKLEKHRASFQKEYFLQTHKSDPEYGLMIGRVRNSKTTLIEEAEAHRDINHGIFVDIYPLFPSPNGGIKAKLLIFSSMLYRLLLYDVVPKNRGILMKVGSKILLKSIPKKMKKSIMNKTYQWIRNQKDTGYLSSFYGDEASIKYPKEWFFPAKEIPFEDLQIPVPANTDKYLTLTYGDYMKLPPVEKRKFHHNYLCIDFDKSYLEYKGKLYCK